MNNYFELQKVTQSYEQLQQVTNELRKSYEQLRTVTQSYKRVIGGDLEILFCEILENGFPITIFTGTVDKNTRKHKSRLRGSLKT